MKKLIRKFFLYCTLLALIFIPFSGCAKGPKGPPPPTPKIVKPKKPYRNAKWIKGHWEWRNGRWVWIKGRWK